MATVTEEGREVSKRKGPALDNTGGSSPLPRHRLRVLIDASIVKPDLGGLRTYTLGLVQALGRRPELELHVLTSEPQAFRCDDSVTLLPVPVSTQRTWWRRALWRERHLERVSRRVGAEVIFWPVPEISIRRVTAPLVVTVHDLIPLVAPALAGWARWARYLAGLRRVSTVATTIVCPSHATQDTLVAVIGADPERCRVVGEGPQLDVVGEAEPASVGEGRPYLLYVGAQLLHKNVPTLLAGFASARLSAAVGLRLAGPISASERARLEAQARALGCQDRVHLHGFVSTSELASLYENALAVCLPSLIEGFGLPILEAMTFGKPVVMSDIPALRELAGDAALYVRERLDPDAWRMAIERICSDGDLRERLAGDGRSRAELFSWERVAEAFVPLLQGAAASGGGLAGEGSSEPPPTRSGLR